jgi:hypothetical protein
LEPPFGVRSLFVGDRTCRVVVASGVFSVGGFLIWWEHQRVRPHRTPAGAIALALAVGLGALLVGLSVAPQVLPGDTFRVVPRTIGGAAVDDPTQDRNQALHAADSLVHSHAAELAVVFVTGYEGPSRWPLGLRTPTIAVLVDRAVARPGCRGPPSC